MTSTDHAEPTGDRPDGDPPTLEIGFVGPIGVRTYSFLRYLNELTSALGDVPGIRVSHIARPQETPHERRPSRFLPRRIVGRVRRRLRRRRTRRPPPGLQDFHADVYHLIAPGDSWLIPELPHDRVVVTVHDILAGLAWGDDAAATVVARRQEPGPDRYFQGFATAAHIVCVSELARQEVLDHVKIPPERVSVILNGLHARFRPLPTEATKDRREQLPPARHRILQLSSINQPRKNTNAVLRVLARLRDDGEDVRLLRVGAHFSMAETKLAEELGVTDRIDEIGRVDDDGLVELYNIADVMLFPSFHEGFGWPPLEAMACGTPVVASDIAACREVIGDAGLLADPRDIEGLTAHVAALLRDRALAREYRQRGLARAAEFTWTGAAAEFAALYHSLV